jgi:hypothetical protein
LQTLPSSIEPETLERHGHLWTFIDILEHPPLRNSAPKGINMALIQIIENTEVWQVTEPTDTGKRILLPEQMLYVDLTQTTLEQDRTFLVKDSTGGHHFKLGSVIPEGFVIVGRLTKIQNPLEDA